MKYGEIKFVEDRDKLVDWEKEWEILVLFLDEKDLISEYREFRDDFWPRRRNYEIKQN